MAISEDLTLNIAPALAAVAELGRALDGVLKAFAQDAPQEINAALSRTDAAPVQTAIEGAVKDADKIVKAVPDATDIPPAVEGAIKESDKIVKAEPDATALPPAIADAIEGSNRTVTTEPDVEQIPPAVEAALAEVDATIVVEADTAAAEESLGGLSETSGGLADSLGKVGVGAEQATGGIDAASKAADIASGATAVLGGNFAALASKAGPYGVAIAGVAAVTGVFVGKALASQEVMARFTETFGPLTAAIEQVDIGGLNTSLGDLAIQVGASAGGLRTAATDFGRLAIASGATQDAAAKTAEQLIALSAAASVLKPSLGSADQVIGGLTSALARGGRTLAEYGIALTTAEIQQRAMTNTGKTQAAELTQVEKATAGAQLATEKYGDTLGTTVEKGSKQTSVMLRSLRTEITSTISGLGAPLIEPVLAVFKSAAPAIGGIVKIIGVALQVLAPIISGVALAFQVIGPIIGAVAVALDFLSPALKVVGVVLLALTGPLGLVVAGFTAVKAVIGLFREDTEKVNQEVAKTPPVIANMGSAVSGLGTRLEEAGAKMQGMQNRLVPIPALVESIAQTVEVNVPGIAAAFDKASKDTTVSLMSFQVALSEQLRAQREFFSNLHFIIASGGQEIAALLAAQGSEQAAISAKAIAAGAPAQIKALNDVAVQLKTLNREQGKQIAVELATGMALQIQNAIEDIRDSLSGASNLLGRLFSSGVATGITSGAPSVSKAVQGIGSTAARGFGATIDARSPSRVAIDLASKFGEGIVIGLNRSVPAVRAASSGIANALGIATTSGLASVASSSSSTITVAQGAVQITFAGGVTPSAVPGVEAVIDQAFGRLLQELGRK